MAEPPVDPPDAPDAAAPASPSASTPARRPPRTVTQRLHVMAERVVSIGHRHDGHERRLLFYPIYAARVLIQVIKQWMRDRCPQQASSLAFGTALSLVPLIAICLAVLRGTGEFQAESSLVEFLSRQVLPVSREEIARYLLAWAGNMSFQAAGIAGVVTTTTLAILMYYSIEETFNDIWRVERRRSLSQKFVVFYAVFTMVPALLGVSLYQVARAGLNEGVLGSLGALGATWGGLFLANKLLPATKVKWGPAAAGALFSAFAFEAAKNLFHLYVARVAFQSYAGVYGTLGLVPIFLVWIYYTWLVVLLGAEIAHSMQNLHQLEGLDRRQAEGDATQIGAVAGARVLCAIVARWRAGARATPRAELVTRFRLAEDVVEGILHRLRAGGLVIEIEGDAEGYLPARPPDTMTLADVLALFRGEDVSVQRTPTGSRLDAELDAIETATRDRARAVTIDDLAE